jgi:hypothetical protein
MNKNFDYDIIHDENVIEIINYHEESFSISINDFWNFIFENGLNAFCFDYYDPSQNDGHGQKSGVYTREQYFNYVDENSLKNDLATFLKNKFNKPKND